MAHAGEHAWWQRGVIYQIYPRSFQDGNGDGIGDLRGITERLDHLVWLGVDALWLSPVFTSPMEDGGYDVADYTAIDPMFGTVADADVLIAEAHRRGLKVILDFVPNHTSHQHPWFIESRAARDSVRRDWYLWRDPAPDGGPPNNWRSASDSARAGSAWVRDEGSGQYFLATFSSVQPDLNWANPDVRAAMRDVLRFWLDRGVDGFRIDMVGFLGKDPEFRDEPPAPDGVDVHAYFRDSRYHFNQPETVDHLRELREVVDAYPDRVLIGEMAYHAPIEQLVSYQSHAGIDLPTNFSLITLPLAPDRIAAHVDEYDAAVADAGAWPNYCLGNHDMPRVSGHGPARARLALLMLLTLRGTPFFYYGDEIGMANVEIPPERRDDRWAVSLRGMTRDSVRTPMQWDAGPNAGFCPEGVQPWLPVGHDHDRVNVARQREEPGSLLHLVRRVLELRRRLPALSTGTYRRLTDVPEDCLVYLRAHDDGPVVVALNFGERDVTVDPGFAAALLLETGDASASAQGRTLRLAPGAGALVGPA
ncbi:MAG TPA: alpha-amylase family glycosyl hydrolase [Euzebyales bacterium]|nr:alpha-amylase family glycosyl hydrolase [Euzebyales bacterium]